MFALSQVSTGSVTMETRQTSSHDAMSQNESSSYDTADPDYASFTPPLVQQHSQVNVDKGLENPTSLMYIKISIIFFWLNF